MGWGGKEYIRTKKMRKMMILENEKQDNILITVYTQKLPNQLDD